MTRFHQALCLTPLLLAAACNVTKDAANDSTTLSVDQNRIENGADALLNEAAEATDVAANAIENTVPAIENSAATIKERAGRVGARAETLGNRIEARTDGNKAAENSAHANH